MVVSNYWPASKFIFALTQLEGGGCGAAPYPDHPGLTYRFN